MTDKHTDAREAALKKAMLAELGRLREIERLAKAHLEAMRDEGPGGCYGCGNTAECWPTTALTRAEEPYPHANVICSVIAEVPCPHCGKLPSDAVDPEEATSE